MSNRGRDDADEQLAAARARIAARDPSFMLGRATEAERAAWQRLEENRARGASAEQLHDLTQSAVDRSNSVRNLHREAHENGSRRR